MALDINILLNDDDLKPFIKGMQEIESRIKNEEPEQIIAAAQAQLNQYRGTHMPPFISDRLDSVESLVAMARDVGFELPVGDRHRVLAALAYLADPQGLIPDSVPVLGFLDDAIMIEICRHDLRHEIEAYEDFCEWRSDEAEARGIDPATLMVERAEWADVRAAEAIKLMRRRRSESYASGAWKPTMFKVS